MAVVLNRRVWADKPELVHASLDVDSAAATGGEEQHVVEGPERAEKSVADAAQASAGQGVCFTHPPRKVAGCGGGAKPLEDIEEARIGVEKIVGFSAVLTGEVVMRGE